MVYSAEIRWRGGFAPAATLPEGAMPLWAEAVLLTAAAGMGVP